MNPASKALLDATVKEWAKFVAEREKMTAAATEIANITRTLIHDNLAYLKTQNVEIESETSESMKILGAPITVEPIVEAAFPNVKASVHLKCGEAARSILINPNMTISAGGVVVTFDAIRKAIPDPFATNAADFVRDAFLYVARNAVKTH